MRPCTGTSSRGASGFPPSAAGTRLSTSRRLTLARTKDKATGDVKWPTAVWDTDVGGWLETTY